MQIIETNLSFSSLSSRSKTNRIILHHAEASTCSPQDIHAWHKANGWSGAGYHFLVLKDGKVYRLRPEHTVGAHASGANSDSIGICFEGAYNRETMGSAQINAGRELVAYLKSKYGVSTVLRHKDVGSTDCPGNNFPFDAIVSGATAGWQKDDRGWWYRNADGSWPKSTWQIVDGYWYYFGADGYAVKGWQLINGHWYYFRQVDDPVCSMYVGWLFDGKYWYYMRRYETGENPAGSMIAGETVTIGGKTYGFDKDGRMFDGITPDGELYIQVDAK